MIRRKEFELQNIKILLNSKKNNLKIVDRNLRENYRKRESLTSEIRDIEIEKIRKEMELSTLKVNAINENSNETNETNDIN